MFHYSDCLFFGRTENGSVRILKLNQPPPEWPQIHFKYPDTALLDVTIPAHQWATIVGILSASKLENFSYYKAFDFHMGIENDQITKPAEG